MLRQKFRALLKGLFLLGSLLSAGSAVTAQDFPQGPECAAIAGLQRLVGQARSLSREGSQGERSRTVADIRATMANLRGQDFKRAMSVDRIRPHAGDIAAFLGMVAASSASSGMALPGAELARLTRLFSGLACRPNHAAENDQSQKETEKPLPKSASERAVPGNQSAPLTRLNISLDEMREEAALGAAGLFLVLGAIAALRLGKRARRRAVRHPCHIETTLMLGKATLAATVHDISLQGAKLSFSDRSDNEEMPALKTPVVLFLGGAWVQGHVVWANKHFIGVLFEAALPQASLRLILDKPAATAPRTAASHDPVNEEKAA